MSENPFGILVVDKEKGMTSHDVVDAVRRKFAIKKVGHAGTLDPNATGVLVILLGKATKLSDKYSGEGKEYEAVLKLGEKTDSADCEGNLIEKKEVSSSEEEIADAMAAFLGETEQVPPMVSAKKVDGKRLYKLARKGVNVERKPRKIVITKIDILNIDLPFVRFRVACSKGTYIRQLAEDIGEKLGCGAHLTELRRVKSGDFSIDEAVSFSKLMKMKREDIVARVARP